MRRAKRAKGKVICVGTIQQLLPISGISAGGSGANRVITLRPAANAFGTARVTISVSDGNSGTSRTFDFQVEPVPDGPEISAVPPQTTSEDAPLSVALGISSQQPAASVTLSATSSNPALLPNQNITLSGSGASRTLLLTPAPDQSGSATITVTALDSSGAERTSQLTPAQIGTSTITVMVTDANGATASASFLLTVNDAPNSAPTLSAIADQTVVAGALTASLPFTVGDAETAAGNLILSAVSSNQEIVPNDTIFIAGTGASRAVRIFTSRSRPAGPVIITLTVTDEDGAVTNRSFNLTVSAPPNTAPTLSNIANQTIKSGAVAGPIAFTVGDAETALASLIITVTSTDPALTPEAGIVPGGTGASRTLTVMPDAGKSGEAILTVTVRDAGGATASKSFTLTVQALAGGAARTE